MIRICYCIVWHCISNVWEAFIWFLCGFGLLPLHIEMLIAFSRPLCWMTSMFRTLLEPPTLLILLEVLYNKAWMPGGERGRGKKAFAHTERPIDFIWSPFAEPEFGWVGLLCRLLWWITQTMPDLTSTRNKKNKKTCAETGKGGEQGRLNSKNLEGVESQSKTR